MSNRPLIIVIAVLGVAVCLIYLVTAIVLLGDSSGAFAPQPTVTRTPPPTARPTFTATPTRTPRVANTPMPSPTPEPTETLPPPPGATWTPQPTPKPPTATPVVLPPPYQLDGDILAWPNCNVSEIVGVIRGVNNLPMKDVQVRAWNGNFTESLSIVTTDPDGNYKIPLPRAGVWFVQVLENGAAATAMRGVESSEGCVNGLQRFQMNWRRIR